MMKKLNSQLSPLPTEAEINRRYGLEPVIETGADSMRSVSPLNAFMTVLCPYCGVGYASLIDLTIEQQRYIEDCQHCCKPIQMKIEIGGEERRVQLSIATLDEA